MGRALLIRVRELVSSCGNFLGWIGDCFGSLESVGCLSDLDLDDESCLGDVCLGVFFLWVFRLYTAPRLCSSLTGLCSSCAETWLLINFCHFKKRKEQ
jgi:hypothetical protein